ncbi:MAG: hypothetical protein BWX88_02217 [Planctomycetes bacterium ADurb.Bin126]|nr:MAG: hypothetical protein BWX88_02217 [Planctomycetes bacterium ADurb.Bin126]HOD79810.1 hypothetical protein [Phycisphaerae bacterium]HQL72818.1 hypothetical protein [Phycisphaerae bacterium]
MRRHILIVLVSLEPLFASALSAAPPAQFAAWGTTCGPLKPVPAGWRLIQPSPAPPPPPTELDRKRGFQILSDSGSTNGELRPITALNLSAAVAEYESASFVLHALRPLEGVTLRIVEPPGPPGGPGVEKTDPASAGWPLSPANVDIRVARAIPFPLDAKAKTYRKEDWVLEKLPTLTLAAGERVRVWLTLRADEVAEHRGRLEVAANDAATSLEVILRILPFSLPPPAVEFAMYYPRPPADDAQLARELIDMREHGMNSILPAIEAVIKTRDRKFSADDMRATREHAERMLRAVREHLGPPRFPPLAAAGHQIAYYWNQRTNWFEYWPHTPQIEADLLAACRLLDELARDRGAARTRIYLADEAAAHNLLDQAARSYALVKQRLPEMETWTTIGGGLAMGVDELGPLDKCVDFFATNRFTPQVARRLVGRGKAFGVYNGAGHAPEQARFFFGFYGWKTAAAQVSQWCYHFGDSPFAGNGLRKEDEGFVYRAADGPVPTLMWEAVREGVDDFRYMQLLAQFVVAATLHGGAAPQAVHDAQAWLRATLATIDWNVQPLRSEDRSAPPTMARMNQWRREAVDHILKLSPQGKPAPLPELVRSPFDHPWASAAQPVKLGEELLPQVGFETGLEPWRVEAWNGKSSHRLDDRQPHAGKQSVRIDIPAGQPSTAVTVLVLPGYGPKPFTRTLAGGSGYELSAWVNAPARLPPQLRVALPDGATAKTQSGQDEPGPDGWQRLWLRVWPKEDAKPKYLALWVQGPGTVWADDVSLRTIIDH